MQLADSLCKDFGGRGSRRRDGRRAAGHVRLVFGGEGRAAAHLIIPPPRLTVWTTEINISCKRSVTVMGFAVAQMVEGWRNLETSCTSCVK